MGLFHLIISVMVIIIVLFIIRFVRLRFSFSFPENYIEKDLFSNHSIYTQEDRNEKIFLSIVYFIYLFSGLR